MVCFVNTERIEFACPDSARFWPFRPENDRKRGFIEQYPVSFILNCDSFNRNYVSFILNCDGFNRNCVCFMLNYGGFNRYCVSFILNRDSFISNYDSFISNCYSFNRNCDSFISNCDGFNRYCVSFILNCDSSNRNYAIFLLIGKFINRGCVVPGRDCLHQNMNHVCTIRLFRVHACTGAVFNGISYLHKRRTITSAAITCLNRVNILQFHRFRTVTKSVNRSILQQAA